MTHQFGLLIVLSLFPPYHKMGVPVFFKWLCMRNPKIIKDAIEENYDSYESGNPYIDNFYIDMNGLIHPACNPKGQKIKEPANFEEQCANIYEYIDKLMNIVRPKRLLYLAIDGVAPRAKMNQQRSRRFRAAMEGAEIAHKKQDLLKQYRKMNISTPDVEQYATKKNFDSNLITPGTTFLCQVSEKIKQYINKKMSECKLWKNLIVVFSDANCPGEGQHKIMQFIRQERASEGYDPNQHHCIYGADADLIMLGLATHEPRFYIIRQIVITANDKWCTTCGKKGHYFMDCRAADSIENETIIAEKQNAQAINVSFQFINLKIIRQYIHLMFHKANISFGYNLERIIDDFVFLCFFVGNDFLPHIPCLSIREGGIDILLKVYDYCLGIMSDYITQTGLLNFQSLKIFINEMKIYEKDIISEIINKESQAKQRQKFDKMKNEKSQKSKDNVEVDFTDPLNSFKQEIKKLTNQQNNLENYSVFSHSVYSYKEKYYKEKLRINGSQFLQLKKNISTAYIEALSWICLYYYKGVCSWSWFYPFHYSPFFTDIEVDLIPTFELGQPFKPFEQLLAVLPPKTYYALPECVNYLMTSLTSPIADYFPCEFQIDLLGKKFAWLGQVLLPFIDDKRLLKAMGNYEGKLTKDQQKMNRLGKDNVFIYRYGPLGRKIWDDCLKNKPISIEFDQHYLEGQINPLELIKDVGYFQFSAPKGRLHNSALKEGIQYSFLQDLNDDFIRRADRKGYGGERFVRVIERSLGQRINTIRRNVSHDDHQEDRREQRRNRDDRKEQRRDTRRTERYDKRDDRRDERRNGENERDRSRDYENRHRFEDKNYKGSNNHNFRQKDY